jgi:hypothetical protein
LRVVGLAGLLLFSGLSGFYCAATAATGPYEGLPPWTYAVLGAAYLTFVWAVWRARAWAWWTLVVLHGFNGAYLLLTAALPAVDIVRASLTLLWPAVYLLILVSERTRAWFGIELGRAL